MTATILRGDARALPLADASVDLIVTSPPYWALRSYQDGGEHYVGQIGAETSPQAYVDALIECTREWVRVLKPRGSLWVNLGDKYASHVGTTSGHRGNRQVAPNGWSAARQGDFDRSSTPQPNRSGVREKSLIGLPWRYALRCIDDLGLILRAEVIWDKPSGLPESVRDRVRRSHEQWFHVTREPRYFSAVDAIRLPVSDYGRPNGTGRRERGGQKPRKMLDTSNPLGALPGSVWSVAAQPFKAPAALGVEHYAAFPPKLIKRIVEGWSPSGICTECGDGRRPVAERGRVADRPGRVQGRDGDALNAAHGPDQRSGSRFATASAITGYACACAEPSADTRPAVVLDPFGGTGTTALVASVLGRHGISIDASADYCRLAEWRTTDPGERARVIGAPKPPAEAAGQGGLFELTEVTP